MRALTYTTLGIGIVTLAALSGACGGGDDGTGGSGAGTSSGGNACDPSSQPNCPAASVESDCVALTDNTGADQFALRLSQLSVTAQRGGGVDEAGERVAQQGQLARRILVDPHRVVLADLADAVVNVVQLIRRAGLGRVALRRSAISTGSPWARVVLCCKV